MTSLGDLMIDTAHPKRRFRHGHKSSVSTSSEYVTWSAMLARCRNPNASRYENYGGRGISVCDRWTSDFLHFLEDMGRRPEGCSLERVDNDGHYEPGNVRWATAKEQCRNRRSNRLIEFRGETKTLAELAEERGWEPSTIHARLKLGWCVERALTQPLRADVRRAAN